jgi:hypothetical protein
MSTDRDRRLAELLHEAAETHHTVFRISDGDDPDWASWYASWLLDLSELPDVLGVRPIRSHLVHRPRPARPGLHRSAAEKPVGRLVRSSLERFPRATMTSRHTSKGSDPEV